MTNDTANQEWSDLKGKIKARWTKFVDSDVDKFRGNMHLVAPRVQSLYGITKDKAEQEYTEFRKTLEENSPATTSTVEKPSTTSTN